eukprot:TRINITY_DN52304_c0_g1_i1.p2 TRINITY_DN52304_c0_g1~~TRINITY_DN52304_c0_g1_i1.p2  ORF type:complete len:117 (-),score=38.67 TRINITY_DN52304_c0_g1_i1:117-467(-)
MATLARSKTEDVDIEVADEEADDTLKEMTSLFKKFDANGDGVLTKEELKEVILALNPPQGLLAPTQEQLEEILDYFMTQMDTNGNGKIEMTEFVRWMHKKPSKAATSSPAAFPPRS